MEVESDERSSRGGVDVRRVRYRVRRSEPREVVRTERRAAHVGGAPAEHVADVLLIGAGAAGARAGYSVRADAPPELRAQFAEILDRVRVGGEDSRRARSRRTPAAPSGERARVDERQARLLALQRQAGNRAVGRVLARLVDPPDWSTQDKAEATAKATRTRLRGELLPHMVGSQRTRWSATRRSSSAARRRC